MKSTKLTFYEIFPSMGGGAFTGTGGENTPPNVP